MVRHVARGPVADHQPDVRPVLGAQRPARPGQLDRRARLAALRDGEPGQRRVHRPVVDGIDHRRDRVDDRGPGGGQGDGPHPDGTVRRHGTEGTSRGPRGHALAPAGAVGHVDEPHGATSASAGAGPAAPSGRVVHPVAAAGRPVVDQPHQAGDLLLGRRPVADVLAGEGVLVHPGPHVARVDPVHAHPVLLGRQHPAELLQRRLGGAVAAPALVALDRRVGGHVDDRAPLGPQVGEGGLDDPQRGHHVGGQHALEVAGPQPGDMGEGARPQRAGVVDHQLEPAEAGGGGDQRGGVDGVGDVAGQGDDAAGAGGIDGGPGLGQGPGVAGVHDQVPAVGRQPLGERPAEPPAGPGDECSPSHLVLPSLLHAAHGTDGSGGRHRPRGRFCLGLRT